MSGHIQRFPLADMGHAAPAKPVISPLEWAEDGAAVEILVASKLWRADAVTGDITEVTDQAPAPGGWPGGVELSRSPDGAHLVALTVFGLFELEADGSWRQITGAGLERGAVFPTRLVWSADSEQVAYVAGSGVGIVVASVEPVGGVRAGGTAAGRTPAAHPRVVARWAHRLLGAGAGDLTCSETFEEGADHLGPLPERTYEDAGIVRQAGCAGVELA